MRVVVKGLVRRSAGVWVRGTGTRRRHGLEPEDHRTRNDALILRNVAASEPEEHRTRSAALILRNERGGRGGEG